MFQVDPGICRSSSGSLLGLRTLQWIWLTHGSAGCSPTPQLNVDVVHPFSWDGLLRLLLLFAKPGWINHGWFIGMHSGVPQQVPGSILMPVLARTGSITTTGCNFLGMATGPYRFWIIWELKWKWSTTLSSSILGSGRFRVLAHDRPIFSSWDEYRKRQLQGHHFGARNDLWNSWCSPYMDFSWFSHVTTNAPRRPGTNLWPPPASAIPGLEKKDDQRISIGIIVRTSKCCYYCPSCIEI